MAERAEFLRAIRSVEGEFVDAVPGGTRTGQEFSKKIRKTRRG